MIVAGVGCRRGCPAGDIVALVQLAQDRAGCVAEVLAAPDFKQDEAGLHEAARLLGLRLLFVSGSALDAAQGQCPTRSAAAEHHTGRASVAEGAALAASGGALLLPRISNGCATCALAGSGTAA